MFRRIGQSTGITISLLIFIFATLALAQWGNGASCKWAFPKWFGCVLSAHESLAGGLVATAGALVAAWIAWAAVQNQIHEERARAIADREEAERVLSKDLRDYADGMAAAWRLLVTLTKGDVSQKKETLDATAFMAKRLSRPEEIANYRAMADILGWDRRRRYNALLRGLEELKEFDSAERINDPEDALRKIRHLSEDFELCLPDTSEFFSNLWRRSPKALSFADYVRRIGGQDSVKPKRKKAV
jgi:hypothetical protein